MSEKPLAARVEELRGVVSANYANLRGLGRASKKRETELVRLRERLALLREQRCEWRGQPVVDFEVYSLNFEEQGKAAARVLMLKNEELNGAITAKRLAKQIRPLVQTLKELEEQGHGHRQDL